MATTRTPARAEGVRPQRDESRQVNVGENERWLSLIGGGTLALCGLAKGSTAGLVLGALGAALAYRGATGHCPFYQATGTSTAEPDAGRQNHPGVRLEHSVTINGKPEDLYRFWRDLSNLPRFMVHLESVRPDGNRSHWVAKGPLGTRAEWDAEITAETPNEMIAWRSLPGSSVTTEGNVRFVRATGGRGTVVKVSMRYEPPAGQLGTAVAWLFDQGPEQQIREDLRRLKQLLEAGEVPTTEGQSSGRGPEKWQQTGFMLKEMKTARGLGYFSIGLGLAEILAHRQLGEMIGVGDQCGLLPLLGLREIASGVGLLSKHRPAEWMWSRVVGDAIDLTLLSAALASPEAEKNRVAAAIMAVAGVTALDVVSALWLSRNPHDMAATLPTDQTLRLSVPRLNGPPARTSPIPAM